MDSHTSTTHLRRRENHLPCSRFTRRQPLAKHTFGKTAQARAYATQQQANVHVLLGIQVQLVNEVSGPRENFHGRQQHTSFNNTPTQFFMCTCVASCAGQCSDHGACRTLREIAAGARNARKTLSNAGHSVFAGVVTGFEYNLWDADKKQVSTQGVVACCS